MKKLFTLLFAVMAGVGMMSAADFSVGGLYYDILSSTSSNQKCASVTYYKNYSYNSTYVSGDVVIPDSVYYNGKYYHVISIGHSAFYACSNMTSITLPSSISSIEDYAFYGCSGLRYINYNVARDCNIGNNFAFASVDSILELRIGKYVNNFPFMNRPIRIKEIMLDSENGDFSVQESVLFNKDMTELLCYPSLKESVHYDIPNGVQYIYCWSFYNCNNLRSISIPNSLITWEHSFWQAQVHDGFSGENLTTIYWNTENKFFY